MLIDPLGCPSQVEGERWKQVRGLIKGLARCKGTKKASLRKVIGENFLSNEGFSWVFLSLTLLEGSVFGYHSLAFTV